MNWVYSGGAQVSTDYKHNNFVALQEKEKDKIDCFTLGGGGGRSAGVSPDTSSMTLVLVAKGLKFGSSSWSKKSRLYPGIIFMKSKLR